MKGARISPVNYIGFAILALCYIGALWNVFSIKKDEFLGKKIIRICHWQLEMGVRNGIEAVADDFEKLHSDEKVKIIQIPITERAYAQWVTTQLIGRMAPDLIELGMFDVSQYLGRYFIPLTNVLRKPNPYNSGNPELRNVNWMDTFKDGLSNSYKPEFLDYYSVGFSQVTVRLFYNKDIYRKILGRDTPPGDLREFFNDCAKIKLYVENRNREIEEFNKRTGGKRPRLVLVPVSSSRYQMELFRWRYIGMFTADRAIEIDGGCDAFMNEDDLLFALMDGSASLDEKKYRVSMKLLEDLTDYFTPGFMSIDRMDAGFSFVQRDAAIITSGSWDASSFIKQIHEQPFGDIILEVDGKPVASSAEAGAALMELKESERITLLIDREGWEEEYFIEPAQGDDLWSSFGIELADHETNEGVSVPVVVDLDVLSPAFETGLKQRRRFEVGVFDFPVPEKDDPEYGEYFVGKVAESSETQFSFGLVKFSKNKNLAIRFLQFATTPENNEKLNSYCRWVPSVKGAESHPLLKPFEPNYKGYWSKFKPSVGPQTKSLEEQKFWPYISGEMKYEEYMAQLNREYPRAAALDYYRKEQIDAEKIPEKLFLKSQVMAAYVFSRTPGEREAAARKLAPAWDVLMNVYLKPAITDLRFKRSLESEKGGEFREEFLKHYNNFRRKEE